MFAKLDQHTAQPTSYQERLSQREQQMHDKDVLISNLNMLLDKRNAEVDRLKTQLREQAAEQQRLENMLQHAIESKMKSLVSSHSEISKLKGMVSNGYANDNGYHSSQSAMSPISLLACNSATPNVTPSLSNGFSSHSSKKKRARHLTHLID